MIARQIDLGQLVQRDSVGLVRELAAYGIRPDLAAIEAEADRVFERVAAAVRGGVQLDEGAWAAIDRQIELAVENVLRRQVKSAVRDYRIARMRPVKAFPFIWIAVMDSNTCVSCEPRHGEIKPMTYWQARGLPGSAALVCQDECRCQVLPMPAETGVDPYVELETLLGVTA